MIYRLSSEGSTCRGGGGGGGGGGGDGEGLAIRHASKKCCNGRKVLLLSVLQKMHSFILSQICRHCRKCVSFWGSVPDHFPTTSYVNYQSLHPPTPTLIQSVAYSDGTPMVYRIVMQYGPLPGLGCVQIEFLK